MTVVSRSGLSVVFNTEPEDYPVWSLTPFYGAKVLLSDPNDYPETTVLYKYVTTGAALDIKVQPRIFQSDDELRWIKIENRGCLFHDEGNLQHTSRYSLETCKTECRMKRFLDTCGCIPYKYPREKNTRFCEFKDLECLNNIRVTGSAMLPCKPMCYVECRDKNYKITSDVMPLLSDNYPSDVIKDYNLSTLSALQVFYDKPTCTCYKQTLLIDFVFFIATYGGVFSISFGASLLTFVEIVYVFLFNAIKYWQRQRRCHPT
ncbi:sodium channel protein Nach-like [Leptidea sinapis]|uniref:sodium channel protein Nach-like n=1 Tax=Leptidea sinapis TaxID=189913 RepID=UPI0021C2E68B|nr:sodium channel protein Nach-like [Leptidea sinapis]